MPTLVNLNVPTKVSRKSKHSFMQNLFLAVILIVSGFFLLQSSFFNINKITVTGLQQLQPKEIIKMSGLNYGENIFKTNFSKAEKYILLNPLVKDVKLKRKIPNQIEIVITEREPVALIAEKNRFIELDKDGIYLSSIENINKVNYPIITGDKVKSGKPGDKIAGEKVVKAIECITALPEEVRSTILEINVHNINEITMYNLEKLQIRMGGPENLKEKAQLYRDIIKNLDKNEKLQYIDLADIEHPAVKPLNPTGGSVPNTPANTNPSTNGPSISGPGSIPD